MVYEENICKLKKTTTKFLILDLSRGNVIYLADSCWRALRDNFVNKIALYSEGNKS